MAQHTFASTASEGSTCVVNEDRMRNTGSCKHYLLLPQNRDLSWLCCVHVLVQSTYNVMCVVHSCHGKAYIIELLTTSVAQLAESG